MASNRIIPAQYKTLQEFIKTQSEEAILAFGVIRINGYWRLLHAGL